MAACIAAGLAAVPAEGGGGPVLSIEGPTGVGKTLAYLAAGLPAAKRTGRRLVVASATVALQEQLIQRDLPDLRRCGGLDFTFAIAKGRGRYLCPSRLEQLGGDGQLTLDELADPSGAGSGAGPVEAAWAGGWDGDLDQLTEPVAEALRRQITNDRHGCLARSCRHFSHCPFFNARDRLRNADVIVANHDLVLADLALGGGALLPPPEECLYVFDEAHHLPDRAISHFSAEVPVGGALDWVDRADRATRRLAALLPAQAAFRTRLDALPDQFRALAEALRGISRLLREDRILAAGEAAPGSGRNPVWRFAHGRPPDELLEAGAAVLQPGSRALGLLEALHASLTEAVRDGRLRAAQAEGPASALGQAVGRLQALVHCWELMLREDPEDEPPLARWITRRDEGDGDFQLACAPLDVATILREVLWQRCAGAVLTSATLRGVGGFGRFRAKCGLQDRPDEAFVALDPPFDVASQAVLKVPDLGVEPRAGPAYTEAVIARLPSVLEAEGGTLVLFTARRQMEAVAAALPRPWRDCVRMQGERARRELLAEHRAAIEHGSPSVLFGLTSFSEGLDLPGDLCRHVIIVRLPFSVPDSPVEAARAEWVEARGGNPFMELAVPDASLRLVQAVGRLLRTETDQGTVTILDRRILTRPYGRLLLSALPPFPVAREPA